MIENLIPLDILKKTRQNEEEDLGLIFEENNKEYRKYMHLKNLRSSKNKEHIYRGKTYICLGEINDYFCTQSDIGWFWKNFYQKYSTHHNDTIVCRNLHKNIKSNSDFLQLCCNIIANDREIQKQILEDEWCGPIAKLVFSWGFSLNLDRR